MTKEEKIKEAYKDYMNNDGLINLDLWRIFKAGVEWANTHSVNF